LPLKKPFAVEEPVVELAVELPLPVARPPESAQPVRARTSDPRVEKMHRRERLRMDIETLSSHGVVVGGLAGE
jgi:hypothetical protein